MKVFFDMVGCRLNQSEIERMANDCLDMGHEVVETSEVADTIIINTCCVTAKASADSRKMIRHYKNTTKAKVVVTGCWATIFQQEAAKLTAQELVYGNNHKLQLPSQILSDKGLRSGAGEDKKPNLGSRSRTRSFIKVQDGCDNKCTYCLTTFARGISKSLPAEEVISHIKNAENQGVKEIVLTGVQIGSWGRDLGEKVRFSDLVGIILADTAIPRIRISSIEPWDIGPDLLVLFSNPRLLPHLHIPLQSGSEFILKKMARPTTPKAFFQLVDNIKKTIPEISLTTDIIAGFPGETDAYFQETCSFLESLPLSRGHAFRFSPMPGTQAALFDNKIGSEVAVERTKIILNIFSKKSHEHKLEKIETVDWVLWEKPAKKQNLNIFKGLTRDFTRVLIESDANIANQITQVKICKVDERGGLWCK